MVPLNGKSLRFLLWAYFQDTTWWENLVCLELSRIHVSMTTLVPAVGAIFWSSHCTSNKFKLALSGFWGENEPQSNHDLYF